MAISLPKRKTCMGLAHKACGWSGTTDDLNDVEGYTCPKCGEPLFPLEWLDDPPQSS
jgi:hypothetical protein